MLFVKSFCVGGVANPNLKKDFPFLTLFIHCYRIGASCLPSFIKESSQSDNFLAISSDEFVGFKVFS